jgi:hypothetical protein
VKSANAWIFVTILAKNCVILALLLTIAKQFCMTGRMGEIIRILSRVWRYTWILDNGFWIGFIGTSIMVTLNYNDL